MTRLSKLQKTILAVLYAMDKNDWETFYSKHQQNNQPPYWHKLRREYFDKDGTGYKQSYENGVKGNVELAILKQKGFKSFTDTFGKTDYFDSPYNEQVKNKWGYPVGCGASCFSVSFSRSIKTLLKKNLIEARYWKREIKEVKLNVNNQVSSS